MSELMPPPRDPASNALDVTVGASAADAALGQATSRATGVARGPARGGSIGSGQLRLWFAGYLLWLGVLTGGTLLSFGLWRQGHPLGLPVWAACLGTFYLSLANSFVPVPTAWIIMLLASDAVGLPGSAVLRVSLVATLSAVATGMANLNEYHVLRWALGNRLARRVKATRPVRWAIRWFRVWPFGILTLAAFVPIPIDAVRWLAIADGYSRWRYFCAYALGRWGRYFGLAGAATLAAASVRTIFLVQAGILAVAAVPVVLRHVRRRVK